MASYPSLTGLRNLWQLWILSLFFWIFLYQEVNLGNIIYSKNVFLFFRTRKLETSHIGDFISDTELNKLTYPLNKYSLETYYESDIILALGIWKHTMIVMSLGLVDLTFWCMDLGEQEIKGHNKQINQYIRQCLVTLSWSHSFST